MCILITKSNSSCQGSHFTGVGTDPSHPTVLVPGLSGDLPHWGMMLWLHCSPGSPPGGVWGVQWPPLPPWCAWHLLSVTQVPHAHREPSSPSGGRQESFMAGYQQQFVPAPWARFWFCRDALLARAASSWSLWLLLGCSAGLAPTAGLLPQAGQSCHFHITRAFAALYPCVSSILFLTFYQFQFVFVYYFLPGSQLFKNNIMNVFYMSYVCVISQLLRLIYHRLSILHLLL